MSGIIKGIVRIGGTIRRAEKAASDFSTGAKVKQAERAERRKAASDVRRLKQEVRAERWQRRAAEASGAVKDVRGRAADAAKDFRRQADAAAREARYRADAASSDFRHRAQVWKMTAASRARDVGDQARNLRHGAQVKKLEGQLKWARFHPHLNLFFGVLYDLLALASFINGSGKKKWTSHAAGFLLLMVSAFHFLMDFAERKAE